MYEKPLRACYCSEIIFLRYGKAPAGMLLLRNAIFEVRKSPCGHVTAQKYSFWGTKEPLRACHCSETLFLRYEKDPAGMLLLRNAVFEVRKSPCGHVTAQKCSFWGTKKPQRACYCSEMLFLRYDKAPAGMWTICMAIHWMYTGDTGKSKVNDPKVDRRDGWYTDYKHIVHIYIYIYIRIYTHYTYIYIYIYIYIDISIFKRPHISAH